jgi:hypothetical protein
MNHTKKRHNLTSKFLKYIRKNKKSYKFLKSQRKTKKRINHNYYLGGALIDEAVQIQNRDSFRAMFIPSIAKLKNAINDNNSAKIDKSISEIKNGFKNQKMGINLRILANIDTFQPIDKINYSLEESPNIALLPCLVIIYENIPDTKIRKKLTEAFVKNGGNINLKSSKQNITALSDAIKLKDKSLIQFLKNKDIGASEETLTEVQLNEMNSILTQQITHVPEQIVEPITEQSLIEPEIPTTKLIISTELPTDSGYPLDVEPEFWTPLFGVNNMFALREKLHSMMISDIGIKMDGTKITTIWSVCKIIQNLIPTYFVPNENKPYRPQGEYGPIFFESPTDFTQYNIVLCATLLVFGIISQKMKQQDYELIFKGGKAIQLVLADIPGISMYESEDIDILLMPNEGIVYDEINVKNLSGHISYLVNWFLTITTPIKINISVLAPNPNNKRANPFIYKLSYTKQYTGFKAISDVDFREIPEMIKPYFERSVDYQFTISELDEKITFKCPDIGSLLDEKLYYYIKYTTFKDLLSKRQQITEPGYETLTISECNRLLDKFKRAIVNLNKGLQTSRNPGLNEIDIDSKQITFLENRLKKFNIIEPTIQTMIIAGLYSGKSIKSITS